MRIVEKIISTLDTWLARLLIRRLKGSFGDKCQTSDLDDHPEMYKEGKLSESIRHSGRCVQCKAWETIDWLEEYIDIINW